VTYHHSVRIAGCAPKSAGKTSGRGRTIEGVAASAGHAAPAPAAAMKTRLCMAASIAWKPVAA
jgi:hypothetical protein